ncbi:potassium channel family protein [Polaribacter litorisediminis]|uniref:potassium channel family protein n=1 Tax=Polaribacter litorisediminis TaxID=1908341 RepID=UPI001CBCC4E3|nr:potassium channel family protein [Polaribacter litorisediminis]UAM99954.1 potassium channel family protein [Polaribacter litorisediminis]
MKKISILCTLLFAIHSFSQETKLKKYSHTEFFKMITAEKDSIFTLENAFITFTEKDMSLNYLYVNDEPKDSIIPLIIAKEIVLKNVHFEHQRNDDAIQGFYNIVFTKNVSIYNTTSLLFFNCVFKGILDMDTSVLGNDQINNLSQKHENYDSDVGFYYCTFQEDTHIDIGSIEYYSSIHFHLFFSKFNAISESINVGIYTNSVKDTFIDENIFNGKGFLMLGVDNSTFTSIYGNDFGNFRVNISKESFNDSQVYLVEKNIFNDAFLLHINQFSINNVYRWTQWKGKVLSSAGYDNYLKYLLAEGTDLEYEELYKSDTVFENYKNRDKVALADSYKFEMQQLGQFYDFYKLQHDSDYANQVYIEFKNLETKRYAYLYKKDPSFNSFFTWKINQFLKIFSGYGTNPSLSIIFSLYVIFLFAFVYLLFPNSWDAHGRKRIMNRYAFFFTYMNKKSGIHEVYLDNQKEDLLEFEEFKTLIEQQGKTVPSFFTFTALPLYKWAVSGTKFSANVLKRVDIMKGTWSDLPKSKRIWKSILLIGAFTIAVFYDILIKMINALMLSINTFTTLGFGEIPIKGLPRYLAIIQGFIGWFMLTIFSVSLISQLLN